MLIPVKPNKITNNGNQRTIRFSDNLELVSELERVLNERGKFIHIIPTNLPNFYWKASDFSITNTPQQDKEVPDENDPTLNTDYKVGNDTAAISIKKTLGIFNTTKTVVQGNITAKKAYNNQNALNFRNGLVDPEWLADMLLKYWKIDSLPYDDHSGDDPPYVIPEEHRRYFYVHEMKSYPTSQTTSKTPTGLMITMGATKGHGGTSSTFVGRPDKDGWIKP